MIPRHEIRDTDKLDALTRAMQAEGWVGRPLLAISTCGETQLLTGSHRFVAAEAAKIDPQVHIWEGWEDLAAWLEINSAAWDQMYRRPTDDETLLLDLDEAEAEGVYVDPVAKSLLEQEVG